MERLPIPAAASPEARAALEEGLGWLRLALPLARENPDEAMAALEGWFAAYDRYLSVLLPTLPVTCSAGCSACCADNPRGVTGAELLRIARALEGSLLREEVRRSAQAFERRVERVGEAAAFDQLRAGPPSCPLLEGDRCGVYLHRPVACRMYVAFTPPAWCSGAHPRHADAFTPHLEPPEPARALLLELSEALGVGGLPGDLRRGLAVVVGEL